MKLSDLTKQLAILQANIPPGIKLNLEITGNQISVISDSSPTADLESLLAPLGYARLDSLSPKADPEDVKIAQLLEREWISLNEAADFAETCADTIRVAAKAGKLFSRLKPRDKRNVIQVCPKSVALVICNEIPDPRVEEIEGVT